MSTMTLEEHEANQRGLKACGNGDGRGSQVYNTKPYRCSHCLGSGRYTYNGEGQRIAWHAHKRQWVRT